METGLALLAHASLPMKFQQYAFHSAIFLINRMPSKVLNNASPYLILFQNLPDYKSLRVFGCLCYPFIRPYNTHKLQYRSVQCIFIGYTHSNKGYLCLDYITDDMTKRLMSSPKCRSVEVMNNPARPGSNHKEVNCINYK